MSLSLSEFDVSLVRMSTEYHTDSITVGSLLLRYVYLPAIFKETRRCQVPRGME